MQINIPFKKMNVTKQKVVPVFLPYMGCKKRCIFCSQHEQTGIDYKNVNDALVLLDKDLELRLSKSLEAVELGFFGGTFTLLPEAELKNCLELVKNYKCKKIVSSARCSTRPDAINEKVLKALSEAGFDKIELGVQSFNNDALNKAERGYTDKIIYEACHMVLGSGFELGIQLLPGMPDVSPKIFEQDVAKALNVGANFLRFYPCLVLKGTKLAELWANGFYSPWGFDAVIDSLSTGYNMALNASVPIIRMGLAPEISLKQNILAGVYHDSLGAIVQANALYKLIKYALAKNEISKNEISKNEISKNEISKNEISKNEISKNELIKNALSHPKIKEIYVPLWCQGFFWGNKKDMKDKWLGLGLTPDNIKWHDADMCIIEVL